MKQNLNNNNKNQGEEEENCKEIFKKNGKKENYQYQKGNKKN